MKKRAKSARAAQKDQPKMFGDQNIVPLLRVLANMPIRTLTITDLIYLQFFASRQKAPLTAQAVRLLLKRRDNTTS